ncbi:hypothetical protein ACJPQX_21770 [Vibrio vulnificus]|uniref:hypothetical protein n=1 Tax=Vibrio vulnificus TaxID=672 RepID=UPI0019D4381F|nr:hypothetical protein [Vibrio vulnificus]HCG7098192.1 hypothetical protein [Vibrio parahaemolyticus]HDY7745142.1 hypothetical protein [Vibrio vulnificus]HDY7781890.1 hypothetical protein [Vibrio vulnificus]
MGQESKSDFHIPTPSTPPQLNPHYWRNTEAIDLTHFAVDWTLIELEKKQAQ